MNWQHTPYTAPLIVSAAVSTATAFYLLWRRWHRTTVRVGVLLMLAGCVWLWGHALELASVGLSAKVLWDKVQFVGICIIPPAWLAFTLRATGHERWLTAGTRVLLSLIPLSTFLLVVTNEAHGLIWRHAWLDTSGSFAVKHATYGVGLWVFTAYAYGLLSIGTALLVQALVRSGQLYRWQAGALVLAVGTVWLVNVAEHVFDLPAISGLKLTPLMLGVIAPVIAWGFFSLRLRDIVQVARDSVIETLEDALILLDTEGCILDLNPVARQLLGCEDSELIGRPVEGVLPVWAGHREDSHSRAGVGQEVVFGGTGELRICDVRVSPLTDRHGRVIGQLVVLHDITDLRRRSEELSTVLDVTRTVSSTLDLEKVLTRIAEQIARAVDATSAYICIWNGESMTATVVAEYIGPHACAEEKVSDLGVEYAEENTEFFATLQAGQSSTSHVDDPDLPESDREILQQFGAKTVLYVPLQTRGEVIAYAEVWESRRRREFTSEEIALAEGIARQTAIAIDNARLHAETERRLKEQVALRKASAAISSALDSHTVLGRIAEQMCCAVDATSVYISTTDLETRESIVLAEYISPSASAQERESDLGATYREDDVGFLEALVAGEPYIDHADDPDMQEDDREHLMAYGAQTVLYVPLYVRGHAIGYAELWESRRRREFTPEEIDLCQAIAQNATIAIENARLHADTERRLVEQIALREAGTAITSALDPETVLTRLAEQMGRAIDVTSAYISRHEPETMTYTVIAEYVSPHASGQERLSDVGITYEYSEGDAEFIEAMESGQYDVSQADDPHLFEFERTHMEEYGAQSILYIPLLVQDRLVGYAELWESRRRREFTPQEISLCQDIARQAAIALENARLYEQAQEEISERIRAEERIKASLEEKEVLLQEIHHRVKNNLQVISSLLSLQASRIDSPETLEVFRESQNRIRSMALIHEQLYQSHNLARIDFGAYVRNLAAFLFRSYGTDADKVSLEIETDEVSLGIDQAVPCGLILNELMSNALKHAFPASCGGEIRVALGASEGQVTLMVSDSGVGLPADLDYRATTSLGLQLVSMLVDQLDGEIRLESVQGTGFKVTFPVSS